MEDAISKFMEGSVREYDGKEFRVGINRQQMYRRYVLSTYEKDGSIKSQNKPLSSVEFAKHYGFSCEWPHERVKKDSD